jgi:hypothetical protein
MVSEGKGNCAVGHVTPLVRPSCDEGDGVTVLEGQLWGRELGSAERDAAMTESSTSDTHF